MTATARIIEGDCLSILPTLPDASVDSIVTDPPYPEIDRPYGRLTEAEWWDLMRGVVTEARRVLKPTGSAVFVLQPNQERIGRTRPWLWDFMGWICREWNMPQDAWWWNPAAMPNVQSNQGRLMRPSVKACVWAGPADCYRNQDIVLWSPSAAMERESRTNEVARRYPSGQWKNEARIAQTVDRRGGVTPFNLHCIPNSDSANSAGAAGHGAGTPLPLCRFWVRYLTPPEGTVLDMFCGSGTVGQACLEEGFSYIGIEKMPAYAAMARERVGSRNNLFGGLTL